MSSEFSMPQPQTRMTRQRMVILEELRKLHTHPTADELYSKERERMPPHQPRHRISQP